MNRYSFNIDGIKTAIDEAVEALGLEEGEFEIQKRVATVKNNKSKGRKFHNMADFGAKEIDVVTQLMVQNWMDWEKPVKVHFEMNIVVDTATAMCKKKRSFTAANSNLQNSSDIETTPRPHKRTNILLEQNEVRKEGLKNTGTTVYDLMRRWSYRDKDCSNKDSFCWVDKDHQHYKPTFADIECWANKIKTGEATMGAPSTRMATHFRMLLGPVIKAY